jgi:hypothetical protein
MCLSLFQGAAPRESGNLILTGLSFLIEFRLSTRIFVFGSFGDTNRNGDARQKGTFPTPRSEHYKLELDERGYRRLAFRGPGHIP